jgi:glycosyltransferase involved in cell wall biosynthesis
MISDVSSADLRLLYKHARATICPSYGEGFDYSGVEAMRSGGAVIASDIPVHREVYASAAEYFNPYSTDDLARAIQRVIDPANAPHRQELVRQGAALARRYTYDAIMPQWEAFLRDRAAAS